MFAKLSCFILAQRVPTPAQDHFIGKERRYDTWSLW